jgi:hypothetical protein
VTLESTADEKRRESVIADHAHVNDHGGQRAEGEFWEKHAKEGKGHVRAHGDTATEPAGHLTAKK